MSRLTQLDALMRAAELTHPGQLPRGLFAEQDTHTRVMNAWTPGNPTVSGMGFSVNVFEQISSRAYDVLYPEIFYSKFIPAGAVDTAISPGAKIASVRVRDWRGKGAFRAAMGKDIPTVGIAMNKMSVPLEAGGVSAYADLDDIRSVAMGFEGMNILTEKGAAMRLAYERHREYVFFYGFTPLGFDGYLNSAQVPQTTASTKAAGGTGWASATPAEMVGDVLTAITTVVTQSRGIHYPNRIDLPLAQYMKLAGTNIGGTNGSLGNESVLSYLLRTLPAVNGGNAVEIVPLRYLNDVGVGGTARMIVETVNNDTFYVPDSVPFNMLAPQDHAFATHLYADYKFGGLLRPYPRSALFVDGI